MTDVELSTKINIIYKYRETEQRTILFRYSVNIVSFFLEKWR